MGFRCFIYSYHDIGERSLKSKSFLALLECHICNTQMCSCLLLVYGDNDDEQWIFKNNICVYCNRKALPTC